MIFKKEKLHSNLVKVNELSKSPVDNAELILQHENSSQSFSYILLL